ncbi:MAG: hypothetical protein Q7R43_06360, partial [Candidatus Daviesbacteria bacterium]|nr:hypothetical protein [Candidatus Daviesbacteria bacterium]
IGFYLSMWGFDKHKGKFLLIFGALTAILGLGQLNNFHLIKLYGQMYPLTLFYISLGFSFMFLVIYLFYFLEKAGNKVINGFLSLIRLLGDNTLSIYIYHWIVVDTTIWLLYPEAKYILHFVPLFALVYLIVKQKKLLEYYHSY